VDVLVQSSTGPATHNETVNQSLTLNQTAIGLIEYQDASSNLSLTVNATTAHERPLSVSNILGFLSLGGRTLLASASSSLSLASTHNKFNYVADRSPAGNTLNFIHLVIEQSNRVIPQILGITQTVSVQAPFKPVVIQPLGITDHISTPHRAFMTDTLGVTQRTALVLPTQHITHTINFAHDSPIGRVDQTLSLIQNATFGLAYYASQNIGVIDQVFVQGIFVRSVTHSNFIGHALTWYEEGACERKQYTPFQGENTIPNNPFTNPSDVLQDPQGDTGNFSIYIPYSGLPTSRVTLRKPEMDNRDRNAYTRVNHETRGGKLVVFTDPQWPNVRTLAVTIIGLTETEVDEIQDFMSDTLGQEIGLTDWEGRLWKGVITNPNEASTQDGKARWTVTFEFEGEMLDTLQPGGDDGTQMNLTHLVSAVIV
jgi:hypothetical protein